MCERQLRPMNEEGFLALRAAVVRKACEDYLTAGPHQIKQLKQFFMSDVFYWWSDLDPEILIGQLNRMRAVGRTHLYTEDEPDDRRMNNTSFHGNTTS